MNRKKLLPMLQECERACVKTINKSVRVERIILRIRNMGDKQSRKNIFRNFQNMVLAENAES